MFELKMQSFVAVLIFFEAQILSSMRKAMRALPVGAPCQLITLPRYMKDSDSLIGSLFAVTGMLAMVLIFISLLTVDVVARCVVLSCMWWQLC